MPIGAKISHHDVDSGFLRHLLDVGARRKGLLGTGEQDTADGIISVESRNRSCQLGI